MCRILRRVTRVCRMCWTGIAPITRNSETGKRENVFQRTKARARTRTKAEKRWLRPSRKKPGKEGDGVHQSERWRKRRWSADGEGRGGQRGVNCVLKTGVRELSRLIKETCAPWPCARLYAYIYILTPFSFSFSLRWYRCIYTYYVRMMSSMNARNGSASSRPGAAVGCNYSSSCTTEMQPPRTCRGAARSGTARFAFTNDPFRGNDIIALVAM